MTTDERIPTSSDRPVRPETLFDLASKHQGFRALMLAWLRYSGLANEDSTRGTADWLHSLIAEREKTTGEVRHALNVLHRAQRDLGEWHDSNSVVLAVEGGQRALDLLQAIEAHGGMFVRTESEFREATRALRDVYRDQRTAVFMEDISQARSYREAKERLTQFAEFVEEEGGDSVAFEFLDEDEADREPPADWLVGALIPDRSLTCIYGAPASGKSFLMVDLAMSIATGCGFHGRAVKSGPVVYFPLEGRSTIAARRQAWRHRHDMIDKVTHNFITLKARRAFRGIERNGKPSDFRELIAALSPMKGKIRAIVIDTLARAIAGSGDENSTQEMGAFIEECDNLRETLETTVILVHHVNKSTGELRGNSSLEGALDCSIKVTKIEDATHGERMTARIVKQKGGFSGKPFDFTVRSVSEDERFACLEMLGDSVGLSPIEKQVLAAINARTEDPVFHYEIELMVPAAHGAAFEIIESLESKGFVSRRDEGGLTTIESTAKGVAACR